MVVILDMIRKDCDVDARELFLRSDTLFNESKKERATLCGA